MFYQLIMNIIVVVEKYRKLIEQINIKLIHFCFVKFCQIYVRGIKS